MKTLNNKSVRNEYSENYYRNNPNTRKDLKQEKREFSIDELFEILGLWFYDKSKKYFEEETH